MVTVIEFLKPRNDSCGNDRTVQRTSKGLSCYATFALHLCVVLHSLFAEQLLYVFVSFLLFDDYELVINLIFHDNDDVF
ncbi:unnamed protein product [Triticum turgidum subsp. durum]|uniref:Uncharacterized protein n=1 Tax=Triticum turgidum subsp. durum TaxID=4567 RepID=A0A9R1NZK5_TRITD|nr:unnamed protein product [Triticum turgidum subsp. durum]